MPTTERNMVSTDRSKTGPYPSTSRRSVSAVARSALGSGNDVHLVNDGEAASEDEAPFRRREEKMYVTSGVRAKVLL